MSHTPGAADSPLGKSTHYASQYDPSLLFPIARAPQRLAMGVQGQPPFFGADLWTAYELSWLNMRGKPQVAIAHFMIPAESTHIIESKSFKLYLGSFNGTRFADAEQVRTRISQDLSEAIWRGGAMRASVGVKLLSADEFDLQPLQEMAGLNLDRLDIECDRFEPAPDLLVSAQDEQPVEETLTSRLLKSNCPVTGQPDWGSVQIHYIGPQIEQAGLLQYIVSFRGHDDFHEHCVERMFMDIWRHCKPAKLTVYARYTRRGGLDINPWRTSHPGPMPLSVRTARQ